MNQSLKVFLSCALGAFVGTFVALQINHYYWWVGLTAGFLVGYLGYDFKGAVNMIPAAWHATSKSLGGLHVGGMAWNDPVNPNAIMNYEQQVFNDCAKVNFQCDSEGNYIPASGKNSITVHCSGTFSAIACAAPPEAIAGPATVEILTSIGMQGQLAQLARYQADPMLYKDVIRQLGTMSDAMYQFVILGTAGSAMSGAASGFAGSLGWMNVAVGPGESPFFHVAYGVDGSWLHATGAFFDMTVGARGATGFAQEYSWFQMSAPVLYPEAVMGTEGSAASSCLTAACSAFLSGWGF